MKIEEIEAKDLNLQRFIEEKIAEIASLAGNGLAINALSGGVDSSAVTILGHRALGDRLKTYFLDHGLMREDEPQRIVSLFKEIGVPTELVDARTEFFNALKGVTDPEEKREAITQAFTRTFSAGS
jgi:GMP synthase (glutamine-hydrolysing)